LISTDHEFLEINLAGCTALGKSRDEIIGKRCFELVHATDVPIPNCPCCTMADTCEPTTSAHEQQGRHYKLMAWPIHGPDGRMEAFAHIVTDTTDLAREKERLELFRTLLDQSNDCIEVVDPVTGRILDVNDRGCQDLGYSREEYLSKTIFEIDPNVTEESFAGALEEVRRSKSMRWNSEHRRKDGTTFPVELNISYVRHERDYVVAVVRDISERLEMERTIERSLDTQRVIGSLLRLSLEDEPLDDLLDQALQLVLSIPWLSVESKGAILLVGDEPGVLEMRAQQGLEEEILACCARVPFGRCLCGRAAATGVTEFADRLDERHENTYAGIEPHGHYCVPITYADEVYGVFNTYIGEGHSRHEEEEEFLSAVADTLAGIIARYKEADAKRLAEEQLRQGQRLEAVGHLAGGVAHDFNNLLTVIGAYTDYAIEALHESDPLRADLEEVRSAASRAAGLTRQLLAFSRKQILEPVPLNLDHVISGLGNMLRRLLGENYDVHFHLDSGEANIEADQGQIEQVVMNLVINARDAMPTGGKLTIETACVELDAEYASRHVSVQQGPFVRLSVSDSGEGMDVDIQRRIFEPFFTTKEQGKGTGLGLSTVYGIVKQSKGNIWVYSEPGMGTTFKAYFPMIDTLVHADQPVQRTAAAPGSETILLVEDEDSVRKLAHRILEGG